LGGMTGTMSTMVLVCLYFCPLICLSVLYWLLTQNYKVHKAEIIVNFFSVAVAKVLIFSKLLALG